MPSFLCVCLALAGAADGPAPPRGKVIAIRGEIDTAQRNRVVSLARAAVRDGVRTLVFDLAPSSKTGFGEALSLAQEIGKLGDRRIAFIGQPLYGHGLLVALACDEIVMAESAKLGNAYADAPDQDAGDVETAAYRKVATDHQHDPALALTMVKRDLRVFQVRAGGGGKRYLTEEQLPEFEQANRVLDKKTIKDRGERKAYGAREARELGLAAAVVETLRDTAARYGISEADAVPEGAAGAENPLLLKLTRPLDPATLGFVRRQLRQAKDRGCTLLFVEFDAVAGDDESAEGIGKALAEFPGKTVGWISGAATGPAVLAALGCQELTMAPDAKLGGYAPPENVGGAHADALARTAAKSRIPEAFVRRLVDHTVQVYQVRSAKDRNVVAYRTNQQLLDPVQAKDWEKDPPGPILDKGAPTTMNARDALRFEVATAVADSPAALAKLHGVVEAVPTMQPGWVDAMVEWLTSSAGTVFLVTAGLFCIYLELQMPGFILPAICAGVCFVLFFWSRCLSDLAGSLEIVLFVSGLALLALELFVIPGFGFAGILGIAMMLLSLVLASTSFSVPQSESEVWQMASGIGRIMLAFGLFGVLAFTASKYLGQLPFLRGMVLEPSAATPDEEIGGAPADLPEELAELVGARGLAASTLRPAGRMQIGERFYDVVAQGEFIAAGAEIEVVEAARTRIVVRPARRG